LTVLEKFKSLLLEFAFDAKANDLIQSLHTVFANLYSVLDTCTFRGLFSPGSDGDEQLMQVISCYLRMKEDSKAIWQSGETAYTGYFRATLLETSVPAVPALIQTWLTGMKELADQLQDLETYLSGGRGSQPSIHFPKHFLLSDDYCVTLISLGLQPHLLALLLKFRAICHCDWHQRFPVPAPVGLQLDKPISDLIDAVRKSAQGMPQLLLDYLNTLAQDHWYPHDRLSMLEVVERMQLFNWNLGRHWYQGFVDMCLATQRPGMKPGDFVTQWATWCSAAEFTKNVLIGYNEPNFKFLLKEYERSFGGNLHGLHQGMPPIDDLEWEHIFAQNCDANEHFNTLGGFGAFGFIDRDDFDQNMLWRSGNFTWLSKSANDSLGNKPPNIKAAHYQGCPGHPNGQNMCSNIGIVRKLGGQINALGTSFPAYRRLLEARCAEIAIFALKRFGG
jgi:hypothetical protein